MDAIQLLKKDHVTVRALLKELDSTTVRAAKKRTELLARIGKEIRIHARIEEEIFYPAFKAAAKKGDDDKMFFEAKEEHRAAGDLVLPDLEGTDVASEKFSGRAKVLKELIEHHAKEEETEMFPRAKALLSKEKMAALGDAMQARKLELGAGKAAAPKARKSAPSRKRGTGSKRELIAPNGDKRLIRRDAMGRIKESDELSRSLSQDVRKAAKTIAKTGQGDRGDQKRK